MTMQAPLSHSASSMQRGFSETRFSSHMAPACSVNNSHWSQERGNPYSQYDMAMAQRERESIYTKRRKTASAISSPDQHPHHLVLQSSSYDRHLASPYARPIPSPYERPSHSPSVFPTPMSARSLDSEAWQWSYFPDERSEGRSSNAHHRGSLKPPTEFAPPPRASKQSSRHQRKRSAGCLNCHTIWSPTWRKDSQGLMRCNACGLYLAARGQERPVTLMPKGKTSDDSLVHRSKQSTSPKDSPLNRPIKSSEEEYPFPPYYPSNEQGSYVRPSPSYSVKTMGTSSGTSSCQSLPTGDLLSPINTSRSSLAYSSSPQTSPLAFSSMSLEQSRKLPYPGDNTLGLKGISRDSSVELLPRTPENDANIKTNTIPSPSRPWPETLSRSPGFQDARMEDKSPRLTLPPLSELTRGLSGWRPDIHHDRQYSISQDRKQTELLDVRMAKGGERIML